MVQDFTRRSLWLNLVTNKGLIKLKPLPMDISYLRISTRQYRLCSWQKSPEKSQFKKRRRLRSCSAISEVPDRYWKQFKSPLPRCQQWKQKSQRSKKRLTKYSKVKVNQG